MAGVETGEGLGGAGEGAVNPVADDELWHLADPEVREAALEARGIAEAYRALDEEAGAESTIGDPTVPFGRGVIHQIGSRRQRIRDSIPGRAAREQAVADAIAEAKALGQWGRVRELGGELEPEIEETLPPKGLESVAPKDEKYVAKPKGRYVKTRLTAGEAERILAEEHGVHVKEKEDVDLADLNVRLGVEEQDEAAA